MVSVGSVSVTGPLGAGCCTCVLPVHMPITTQSKLHQHHNNVILIILIIIHDGTVWSFTYKGYRSSKIRLMLSLVTSINLYASESWTLTAELQRRIQAMEMRCYRKILHISYKDHFTNEEVRAKIQQAIGLHEAWQS